MDLFELLFERGPHEARGSGERDEEVEGRELVRALDSARKSWCMGEGEVEDGEVGSLWEGLGDEGAVGRGGEDGDGGVAAAEEVGEVEERDGVAFGHEREEKYVRF